MIRISQYEQPQLVIYYHTKHLPHTDFFKHPEGYQALTFLNGDFDPYNGNPWDQEYYDDFEEHVFKDIEEIEDVARTTYPSIKEIKKYPEDF